MNESPTAHVKARLFKEPLYLEDGILWDELLRSRGECADWFSGIGLELVVDEEEGYAFLRQPDTDEIQGAPRLIARRQLSYDTTLLLVCLRQELATNDARDADQARVIRTKREIVELVAGFLGETNDEVRDVKKVDRAIEQVVDLGFLKRLGGTTADDYEIRRILKARIGPTELESIKKKLSDHVYD